ncbi:hypothetical protein BHE74_00038634 [Ensete ventricosum]|nr:hypothetical protein BHE74_00038634 [Ensete ventricosum]
MAMVAQTPDILGERQSGQDVRTQNGSALLPLGSPNVSVFLIPPHPMIFCVLLWAVVACQAVANIVKSSLGPVGLDKVNTFLDLTIIEHYLTQITRELLITECAIFLIDLQVLVELAELQDREVGDGTTSVVILAAELLKRANDLVRNKIHPTSIISGYRVVDAVQGVKTTNARGEVKYPIKVFFVLMLSQYFVEAGAIAVRRVRKDDLRHVAKATGATVVSPQLL